MHSLERLTRGEKRKISLLRRDLVCWAKTCGRHFPWRENDVGTYELVVVEVLLQRTTAIAVSRMFGDFIARYPGWQELASASIAELEDFLRPLGLWRRRAGSLFGLASYAARNNGSFPADPDQHREIPAVGQYVSNAILLFQYGQARPLLDVNMARLLERFLRPRELADIRFDPWLQAASHWLVRGHSSRQVNWAVLDFAALTCRAQHPRCSFCPVKSRCNYLQA